MADEHVVVVGGGFGGLTTAKALGRAPVRVTVVDRENHHLFQPLLYQVATANLSPGDIAIPIRSVIRRQANTSVLMAEVVDVDFDGHRVELDDGSTLHYDWLVLAAGARTNWFGNPAWSEHAFGLKKVSDALAIRERVLMAFEAAEREESAARRKELLTFVVIGAGPTGVEMAGAISELSRHTLRRDFRRVRPTDIHVMLVEMADRVLPPFDERLSEAARRQLEELSVEVVTGKRVTDVSARGVEIEGGLVPASMVCWASGVEPVPLAERLGVELAHGRIVVEPDCSIPDHPEAFAIGDVAWCVPEGEDEPLPGLAPVAMQQGRYVARRIAAKRDEGPFRYRDKGMMATVGRSRAVVQSKRMRLTGLLAWLTWIFVHIWYLIGFRNRFVVMFNWFWSWVTFKRGARLIARHHGSPGPELDAHPIHGSDGAAEERDRVA